MKGEFSRRRFVKGEYGLRRFVKVTMVDVIVSVLICCCFFSFFAGTVKISACDTNFHKSVVAQMWAACLPILYVNIGHFSKKISLLICVIFQKVLSCHISNSMKFSGDFYASNIFSRFFPNY